MPSPDDHNEPPPRPNNRLTGRVAIVAGAGSRSAGIGNGRAAAILLAESGASEFGAGRAIAVRTDVTRSSECRHTVELALETFGRLDILVNNVGIGGPVGTAVEVEEDAWRRAMDVNVLGMVLMAKYAVPAMEKNEKHEVSGRGAIVNVASIGGLFGGNPIKGAIVNMTRAMAAHHGPSGIRVNCVCPGLLYTPMLYSEGMSQETRKARRKNSLLQTEGNGWDTGLAVRFLASDESRWITGTILTVDAGHTAAPGAGPSGESTLFSTLVAAGAKL
ncbi:short-chain dehydrogenase/reductase SDR [Ephemerocybe angulata]|uniref:Short-chain dehydrogenase/reductase SDR n=1 Tax=Ephemerocybe angulata TaxID=980116 RepID=A0A8H6HQX7_9AGAR|nr:short-chain dehydrogenase/reductase SDR [Tulosesus angulatus]